MKTLSLKSKRYGVQTVLLDDEDFERVSSTWWGIRRSGKNLYAHTTKIIGGKRIGTYMHRFIVDCPAGKVIDHKNGNGLDNQKHNLRVVSQSENCRNQRDRRANNRLGERLISPVKDGFRVAYTEAALTKQKHRIFKTMPEAIAFRDDVLKRFYIQRKEIKKEEKK